MNVIKEHKIANRKKGQVTFGSKHGGQWLFEIADRESGRWTKMMKVRGGLVVAEKIAELIHKSWLRSAGKGLKCFERIDTMARRRIDTLIHVRTLRDYSDEPQFWTNEVPNEGDESVPMNYVNRPIPRGISADDIEIDRVEPEPAIELEVNELEAVAS